MSTSDIEKDAGVLSSPQQPHGFHPRREFLPTYEEHLNTELLNFPKATPQANVQLFDRVSDPATKKAIRCRRAWRTALFTLLFLIVSGIIGTAIFVSRIAHLKDNSKKVAIISRKALPQLTFRKLNFYNQTAPRTSMPARSLVTVTVVPSTVVVTVPALRTSTSTLVVMVPPPPPTRTSTQVITIIPSPPSTTSEPIVTTTASFLAPITLPEASTVTSVSFMELISSTSSTSSTTSPSTSVSSSTHPPPPPPPPTTVSTTLVSVTTATATPSTTSDPPVSTRTGMRPLFCGVPGEACA